MTATELMYSASSTGRCHPTLYNGASGCLSSQAKPPCINIIIVYFYDSIISNAKTVDALIQKYDNPLQFN